MRNLGLSEDSVVKFSSKDVQHRTKSQDLSLEEDVELDDTSEDLDTCRFTVSQNEVSNVT